MAGTAIVAIHVEEGFVVAADGRKKQGNRLVSDSEQKVHSIVGAGKNLGYASAGIATQYADEASTQVVYDFGETIAESVKALAATSPLNFSSYVHKLARNINKGLLHFCQNNPQVSFPDEHVEGIAAQTVVVGYYENVPGMARILFRHRDHKICKNPRVCAYKPERTRYQIAMPKIVGEILRDASDSRLTRYYKPSLSKLFGGDPLSLAEAQEAALTCIEACSDPVAAEIDPCCHTVGGHVHMATITRSAGFQWIKPPLAP